MSHRMRSRPPKLPKRLCRNLHECPFRIRQNPFWRVNDPGQIVFFGKFLCFGKSVMCFGKFLCFWKFLFFGKNSCVFWKICYVHVSKLAFLFAAMPRVLNSYQGKREFFQIPRDFSKTHVPPRPPRNSRNTAVSVNFSGGVGGCIFWKFIFDGLQNETRKYPKYRPDTFILDVKKRSKKMFQKRIYA